MGALVKVVGRVTKSYMEINTVSVDNWTFKCFYKVSTSLLIFSSVIVSARQFFGVPITCDGGLVRRIYCQLSP